MQLILMRHGVAVERDEWKDDDFSRPLTPRGRDKTREAARGLTALLDAPTLIATSPKVRALQTAEITRESWREKPPLEIWPELAEGNVKAWMAKLGTTDALAVLLVGHEPDLSGFASFLLSQSADTVGICWKKAGAMSLELDLSTGRTTLLWMLPPRALRLLGK